MCGSPLEQRPPVVCAACGAHHYRNAKPCAGALVMREGRLLLLRRTIEPWLDHWDIPGGFCEATEHPIDTARRETEEETGLQVEITGFLGMWLDRYPDPSDTDHPVVTLNAYYHALAPGSSPGRVDPAEASELAWFAPDALPEQIAFPLHARDVLAAWQQAVREGRTVTALPDRPPPRTERTRPK